MASSCPLTRPCRTERPSGVSFLPTPAGRLRAQFGAIRDRLIGIKVVNPNGDVTKGGGKVVKNVSGYDMNKLYTGALGTLGIIVEAAFKLSPLFKQTRTLVVSCKTPAEAGALANGLRGAEVTPVALQLIGGEGLGVPDGYSVALQLGGLREAVERQARSVVGLSESNGCGVERKDNEGSEGVWSRVRDAGRRPDSPATMIIKATCLPSDAVTLVGRIQQISGEDWAVSCNMVNGVVYGYWWDEGVSIDDLETRVKRVREITGELNGHCVIEVCPRELKERIDVWGLEGPQVYLMKRIKEQFDPNGTLNPGRFVKGI